MSDPLVSVVLRTYKRADKLAETINSVFNQTYKNWELIVVDDNDKSGSHSRDTGDVVKAYQGSNNVIYIRHGENRGLCAAGDTGIARAKGEFIAFLDDDDIWDANKLEFQLRVLQSNPEVGFVFCDVTCIDHADNTKKWIKYRFGEDLFVGLLKKGAGVCSSTLVIKKEVLASINGFDKNALPAYTDYDLLLRLSLCSKYAPIEVPLLTYNVTSDGVSRNFEAKFTGKKIILERYKKYFSDKSLAPYYGSHLSVLADYAILRGKRWSAVKYYALSISKRPAFVSTYVKLFVAFVGGERLYRFVSDRYRRYRKREVAPQI